MNPPDSVAEKRYKALLALSQRWIRQDKSRASLFQTARLCAVSIVTRDVSSTMSSYPDLVFWLVKDNKLQFRAATYRIKVTTLRSGHARVETYVLLPHEIQSFIVGGNSLNKFGLCEDRTRTVFGLMTHRPSL